MRTATPLSTFVLIASTFLQCIGARAEDRPAVNAPAQPKVNLEAFNAALQQRNQAVGNGQLFEDFADWNKENIILIGLQQQMQALLKQRNALLRKVQPAQAMAPRNPAPLQQLRTAIADTEKAMKNLADNRNPGAGLNVQTAQVLKLWQNTGPRLQQWLNSYYTLRSLLPMDPTSADFAPIKAALEDEAGRPGALEIKVWLVILNCLGPRRNDGAAGIELQQLIQEYEKFFLVRMDADVQHWDIVGGDLFLACILAGQTEIVAGYADALEKLPPKLRTPYRNALVCLNLAFDGRESLLDKALNRPASEWGLLKGAPTPAKDTFEREVMEMVAGQYAFFHFTCRNDRYRDPDSAKEIINLIAPPCSHWLYDLGKSAEEAFNEKWDRAIAGLEKCEERCPAPVMPVIEEMKLAYKKNEQFVQQPIGQR